MLEKLNLNHANLAHCANAITRVVATGWKRSTIGAQQRFRAVASGRVPRSPHTKPLPLVEFRLALTTPDPSRGLHALAIYIDRDVHDNTGQALHWHDYVAEQGQPNLWAVFLDDNNEVQVRVRRNRKAAETSLAIAAALLEAGCIVKPVHGALYRLD